ncbi:flavodoxin domain-containing protein [Agrilactobacillus yilanensis]|uniref:Flavodoxin domain-containing protein n=1 Tax=Agrilactobacillus yilanensis TaxID=2485997 RepID=A0ABW4J3Y3_9LACO|nr:flavodoxin domain-containing protein [Agrilactobacillus yilanensis]
MATIKIAYASMTDNNKSIADYLSEYFTQKGAIVDVSEIADTDAEDLLDYDIDVIVTYTYYEGEIPDDAEDFFDEIKDLELDGKVYGVAGSGSTDHEHFGRAVDYFDKAMQEAGGKKGSDVVKVDEEPDDTDFEHLKAFADALLEA